VFSSEKKFFVFAKRRKVVKVNFVSMCMTIELQYGVLKRVLKSFEVGHPLGAESAFRPEVV